jgi:Tol biopolymer transport system component
MIGSVFAGFPGRNGRIAFVRGTGAQCEIWSVNPDGTDERQLTSNGDVNAQPAWSPDGSKILFVRFIRDQTNITIWVMNADGSGQTQLTTEAVGNSFTPGWAPNGSMIVFARYTDAEGDTDIWVMDVDGSNQQALLDTDTDVFSPAWAPNGTLLAFSGIPPTGGPPQIWVMNANGSNPTQLTDTDANLHPDWHPESTGIFFTRYYVDTDFSDIWGVLPDGSFELLIVDVDEEDAHPSVAPEGNAVVFGAGDGTWNLWTYDEDENLVQITDDEEDSWCPDWQPVFGVGGDIISINRLHVLTPYLAIAVITIGTVGLLRKKHIL